MVRSLKRLFIALLATCIILGSIDLNVFANVIEEEKEKLKEEIGVEDTWDKKTTQSLFEADEYSVYFTLSSYWNGGYNASIKIENTGTTTIENWNLGFNYSGNISNIWNASLQNQTDTLVKIKNAGWNQDIPAGGSVEFGISGQEDFKGFPTSYQLLGTRTQEKDTNYAIEYHLDSDWGSGFTGTITITNKTNEVIEDWRLSFQFDRKITNIWNASIESQDESNYTIANVGYNSSIAAGQSISFGFNGIEGTKDQIPSEYVLYTYKENEDVDNHVDSDQDGLPDNLEDSFGTDKYNTDTDGDGLSDYIEKVVLGLDPLLKDTDGNGIDDGDEDGDNDGLSNIKEIESGTNLLLDDSDDDGLKDGEEVHTYGTSPITLDTDEDGVSDGKEVELGTNPLVYESSFDVNVESDEEDTVKASVDITLSGEQVETLSVDKVDSEFLFPTTMPGYVGGAYDFTVDGTFESATLNFTFDEALLKDQGFDPVIYYFNEETQLLEALETEVNGNVASARTTHFSKYILLNRKVYEDSFEWQDVWDTSGFKNVEVVLVIDDSGSMSWNDSNNQRLSVSKQLIDKLPQNNKAGIVRFTGMTYLLTNPITSDKDYVKSFLTTSYFRSDGGTSMYQAIDKSFTLFESKNEDTLKMMVVLSDGETPDISLHTGVVKKANDNKVKIFTVGLGSSSSYFTKYLKPLANDTSGAFYLASNANELNDIYKDINEKIDIETDSDADGIPDYYEDNMVMFNGVKIKLDKNNPDTDGDGLDDGEEVAELNYQYNADKTKVIVTGKLLSNPLEGDTDGDSISDEEELAIGTSTVLKDTDGDGLDDGTEYVNLFDPLDKNPDGDSILDKEEFEDGTDPFKYDKEWYEHALDFSNGFVLGDFVEATNGTILAGQIVGGFIPYIDVRDVIANVIHGDYFFASINLAGLIPVGGDMVSAANKVGTFIVKNLDKLNESIYILQFIDKNIPKLAMALGSSDVFIDSVKQISKADEITLARPQLEALEETIQTAKLTKHLKKTSNSLNIKSVASEVSADVWKKKPIERGNIIDELLNDHGTGQGLGRTFPVVDRLEGTTLVSTKSLDISLKSYQNPSKLKRTLNDYVKKLEGFEDKYFGDKQIIQWGKTTLDRSEYNKKVLEVVFPDVPLTDEILTVLQDFQTQMSKNNIEIWYVVTK